MESIRYWIQIIRKKWLKVDGVKPETAVVTYVYNVLIYSNNNNKNFYRLYIRVKHHVAIYINNENN